MNVSCRGNCDLETVITVIFKDLPKEIVLDTSVGTTLENEYLITEEGHLELSKKYNNGGKPKVWIKAYHPTNESCSELLLQTNAGLKKIINENEIPCSNLTTNSIMRKSIWEYYRDGLCLETIEIDASKSDAKQIWEKLNLHMPVFTLFQSDRANTDGDSEVQDPLKEAVKVILKEPSIQEVLVDVSKEVQKKLREVSDRTLDKLKEIDEEIANELNPVIPTSDKLK